MASTSPIVRYVGSTCVVAAVTGGAYLVRDRALLEEIVMLYLLAIVVVAVRFDRRAAFVAAALSVAAYDFFFIPPAFTFAVKDSRHLLTFAVMFTVGLVISSLTVRLRRERERSAAAEHQRSVLAAEAERAALRARVEEHRSALLSAVSHDLRTPLATITGTATMLRDAPDALDTGERKELLSSLCDEAERLERFLTNLLDMTRVASGVEVVKEWMPLEEILGSALERLESTLGDRRVTTSLPDDVLVAVDPILFVQVIVNIVDNAVKYTPPGTAIEILGRATSTDVTITIEDRGPGLQAGTEELVFDKFVRGRNPGVGGVGLGLAIARGIVVAHGGSIVASNRDGGGARFVIHLPQDAVKPPAEQPAIEEAPRA